MKTSNKIKILAPALVLASGTAAGNNHDNTVDKDTIATVAATNYDKFAEFREAEKDAFNLILMTEDCAFESYFCGVRWTIGIGNTVHPDGSRVRPGEKLKDINEAMKMVQAHLEKYVYPQLQNYVTPNLNQQQKAALISLFYNVNPVSLTGVDDFGVRKKGPSKLIQSINQGLPVEECMDDFMEFRFGGGKELKGLIKRRYLEAMYFAGHIKPNEILNFMVSGYGNANHQKLYYRSQNYYKNPRMGLRIKRNPEILNNFKKECSTEFMTKKGPSKTVLQFLHHYGFKMDLQLTPKLQKPMPELTLSPLTNLIIKQKLHLK